MPTLLETTHRRWLLDRLPELVAEGVLDEAAAERLVERYGEAGESAGSRLVLVLFAVLGAVLVGGGVILLLAHNWQELSRPVRATLSLAPVAVSLALAGWTVARGRGAAWREGVAAGWVLAIGAALALISQTYQVGGEWSGLLQRWMLLALPVPYLLGSVSAAVLWCLGLVAWAFSWNALEVLLFWPLAALLAPFVVHRLGRRPLAFGSRALAWTVSLTLVVALLPSLRGLAGDLWGPLLASGCLALWGAALLGAPAAWERPFRVVGQLGFLGTAVALSFGDVWGEHEPGAVAWTTPTWEGLAALLVVAAAAFLLALAWRWRGRAAAVPAIGLAVVWLGLAVAARWGDAEASLLVNAYLVAAGVALLVRAVKGDDLASANLGAGLIALLVVLRFFDAEWSFLVRGVVFIAAGLGLLSLNLLWLRRRRKA